MGGSRFRRLREQQTSLGQFSLLLSMLGAILVLAALLMLLGS